MENSPVRGNGILGPGSGGGYPRSRSDAEAWDRPVASNRTTRCLTDTGPKFSLTGLRPGGRPAGAEEAVLAGQRAVLRLLPGRGMEDAVLHDHDGDVGRAQAAVIGGRCRCTCRPG
jgi:hypothetical protein